MKTSEKNRLENANPVVRKSIEGIIDLLDEALDQIDRDLERLHKSQLWREQVILLRTGYRTSRHFQWQACQLNRREIAALVGVAPLARDREDARFTHLLGRSGCRQGRPLHAPCRRSLQVLKDFYTRLVEAGKPKKVAITACMRKLLTILNAMVKQQAHWNPISP